MGAGIDRHPIAGEHPVGSIVGDGLQPVQAWCATQIDLQAVGRPSLAHDGAIVQEKGHFGDGFAQDLRLDTNPVGEESFWERSDLDHVIAGAEDCVGFRQHGLSRVFRIDRMRYLNRSFAAEGMTRVPIDQPENQGVAPG